MSEREIITLQLGNYSNHVATHWWNLHQNSTHRKDHNSSKNDSLGWESTSSSNSNNDSVSQISKTVLWRVGEDSKGVETCTPRTIILDEKHNLGTLPQSGGPLYDEDYELFESLGRNMEDFKSCADIQTWHNQTEIQSSQVKEFTPHQVALNSDLPPPASMENPKLVSWGDYSYTYYHPKSIIIPTHDIATVQSIILENQQQAAREQLREQEQNQDLQLSFNNWLLSRNLWARPNFRDTVEDNIRYYSEECDWLEGFLILSDSAESSGFAGLSNIVSHYLDDDYHKKCQLHFPISKFSGSYFLKRQYVLAQNLLNPKNPAQLPLPSFKDWLGLLGHSMILYDLSLSTSACDAITNLSDLGFKTNQPVNFHDKFNTEDSDYHSAAVVACYLETATTPFRTSNIHSRLRASDIANSLTANRRRMFLETKLCFRDDQKMENFCSVSGLNIKSCMQELSYSSMPICRGTNTSPEAYYSNTEKVYMDSKNNHFAPKILKNKNKSGSRSKNSLGGEVVYTDWCSSRIIGQQMRDLFTLTKRIPKYVLANLAVSYDLEMDEIGEAFIGFDDVLDDYEQLDDAESEISSDDDY